MLDSPFTDHYFLTAFVRLWSSMFPESQYAQNTSGPSSQALFQSIIATVPAQIISAPETALSSTRWISIPRAASRKRARPPVHMRGTDGLRLWDNIIDDVALNIQIQFLCSKAR